MENKTIDKASSKKFTLNIEKKYYNYKLVLCACLVGLTMMFFSLTLLSFISHFHFRQSPIKIPIIFYFNTLVLLISSGIMLLAQINYKNDNYKSYKTALLVLLALGILFLIGQTMGWYLMYKNNFYLQNNTAAYIYVISGIHAIHIIGALLFLIYFITNSWKTLGNYATSVIYFTDPIAKAQLNLFAIFWHYLGIIWLYLLLFFIAIS